MGGKQSKDKTSSNRALFMVHSTSLDSISTSVSLRTHQSTSTLQQSPSMDTIKYKSEKPTTKDEKGNMYTLLETASTTDCETTSVIQAPEIGGEQHETTTQTRSSDENSKESKASPQRGDKRESADAQSSTARRNGLTASLPSEVDRCVLVRTGGLSTHTATELARRKDSKLPDANKSKLVQRVLPTRSQSSRTAVKPTNSPTTTIVSEGSKEMEREVEQLLKSMLKQQQVSDQGHTHDKNTSPPAQLPEPLLQCSQKELNHLASYICHTIKDTLQSSLVEQALTAQQQKSAEKATNKGQGKHVQIKEGPVSVRTASISDGVESPHGSRGNEVGSGERYGRSTEDRLHRRRYKRSRRERPVSSPGVYCEDNLYENLSDPQTSTSHGVAGDASPPSPANEPHTHSNEESYYHRCSAEQSPHSTSIKRFPSCRACRQQSRNSRSPPNTSEQLHDGVRRKRVGRSKDTPVDVSLDDNCPGVNIVRRRYTHHHHAVCEKCLQSLEGKEAFCKQSRRRQRHAHSPEIPRNNELQLSPDGQEVRGVGEGSGFITLYQLRTVAQALKESTGYIDQEYEKSLQRRSHGGPPKSQSFRQERKHNQHRLKNKQKNVVFDDCLSVVQPIEPFSQQLYGEGTVDATVSPSTPEELGHFQELAYPTKTRSGRDSPATDMAVIDLSVDSPCMLQPLECEPCSSGDSTSYTIQENSSPNKITHLHHHYHHIIHHGEP